MTLYMTQFAYTAEAWAALAKNPQDRGAAFGQLVEKMGGKMVGIYYCFGEYDGLVLYEAPDETTALATILAAITPGHLKATRTTMLFTMENTLEAMRKAGAVAYPGPR
jgi:uncharacterized protein with GYD domain